MLVPDRHAWAGEGDVEPADVYRHRQWMAIWETCSKDSKHFEFFEEFFM
jgi:hypothetical protein